MPRSVPFLLTIMPQQAGIALLSAPSLHYLTMMKAAPLLALLYWATNHHGALAASPIHHLRRLVAREEIATKKAIEIGKLTGPALLDASVKCYDAVTAGTAAAVKVYAISKTVLDTLQVVRLPP